MIAEKTIRKEIIALAEHTKYYTNLLIKQCDNWLPEDEGAKNMEMRAKKVHRLHGFKQSKKISL